MARYPELLEKQAQDYKSQGLDWREIAKERVFPNIAERLPSMREARENLLKVCGPIYERATGMFGAILDVTFVIYVGLGCGAGWTTQYGGSPACLLGLENITECRWSSQERLQGLVAHEIGHLVHKALRSDWDDFCKPGPLFQLYSEGFAQRCEHLILGGETWHEAHDEDWLSWCQQHQAWLAREYLHRVDKGIHVNDFFGSWFDIQGQRHTGYFLGHEFIRSLEEDRDVREIATLPLEEVEEQAARYLRLVGAGFSS